VPIIGRRGHSRCYLPYDAAFAAECGCAVRLRLSDLLRPYGKAANYQYDTASQAVGEAGAARVVVTSQADIATGGNYVCSTMLKHRCTAGCWQDDIRVAAAAADLQCWPQPLADAHSFILVLPLKAMCHL
jgi:hypothetical protein